MFAIRRMLFAALFASMVAPAASPAAEGDKLKFDDLPKAVKKAVREKFPEAKYRGISKEKDDDGDTVFEVEMTIEGKSVDIIIDDEGEIEAIEREIEFEDLPRAVIKAARARFPGARIEKVEEVSDDDDVVVYEIAFSSKEKSFEVVMSPNGKILEDDDEDEAKKGEKEGKDDDKKGSRKGEKEGKDVDDKQEKPKG